MADLVELSQEKRPRISVKQGAHAADSTLSPLMKKALDVIADKDGDRLSNVVSYRKFPSAKDVAEELVSQGVLRRAEKKVMFVPVVRYEESNPDPESHLRRHLAGVLTGTELSTEDDAIILSILNGVSQLRYVFKDDVDLTANQMRKRVEEITDKVLESSALGNAVQQTIASVIAAVTALTAATTVS